MIIFQLSLAMCPKIEEKEHMKCVPYSLEIGNLMYAMTCTCLDIAHAVAVVKKFMSNLGKQHWQAV